PFVQLPTDERGVGLDLARQRLIVLAHQLVPNPVKHPPRGLVVAAKLALDVLRGDTATRARHEEHDVEPVSQRTRRLGEDRPCGRVNVVTATRACPRLALLLCRVPFELSIGFALGAVSILSVLSVSFAPKPFKARIIVWELSLELVK